MKRIRKRLAWLLAMAMMLTALPVGVLAEEKDAPGEETPVCSCEAACTAGAMNTDCPICGDEGAAPENCGKYQASEQDGAGEEPGDAAPQEPSAIEQVQTVIDALPTAEELKAMDAEGQQAVYADLQAAYDAYEALSDDEKLEVTGADIMDDLFAVFNGMVDALTGETGDFLVTSNTGDAQNSYSFSNGVLTVDNGADITISMANGSTNPTGNRIVIAENATASIKLNGVNIKGAGASIASSTTYSAITLSTGSSLTLTLAQNSTNTLKGGDGGGFSVGAPAIRVPEGRTLTVRCANENGGGHVCGSNCGALSAIGGESTSNSGGVGIGGGVQDNGPLGTSSEGCGTVLLLGGNITVSGGSGSGSRGKAVDIGGANNTAGTGGAGGTVIILTDVTSSDNTLTVGGGTSGTGFAASDNGAGIRPSTGDNAYEVYGNLSLPADLTIPAGVTVNIPQDTNLTVPENVTLTNNGAITGAGTLNGDGRIQGTGTISVTNNNFKTELEIKVKKNGADATQFYYGDVITVEVTPKLTSGTAVTNGISALSSTDTPTVSMSYNDTQLASTTEKDGSGTYTLQYDTSNKGLPTIPNLSLSISFSGGDNMAASSGTAAITLNKKNISASVSGEVTKVYDQNTSITLPLTLTDIVQGDEITATVTGTFADSQVGDNNTVTLGNLETSGADKAWYTVTCTQTSVTGSITAAALDGTVAIDSTGGVTPGCTLTATYTKTSDETVSYQWNRDGAAISGATETTYTITAEDEGQQITVTATALDSNHTGSVTSQAVTAGNRPVVTITGVAAQSGIYNGQSHAGYTGTPTNSNGYTGGYRVTYSGRGSTIYPDSSNPPTNAGDYYVTFELADTTAYTGNLQVPFSISKRSLVLQAEDKTAAVGTARPELTYVISGDGLVIGENLTTEPILTCDADMNRAGAYPITVSGAAASDNYEISYQDGTLDVKPLSIENAEVTLSPSEYTYDGSPKIPSVTVVLNGSTLSEDTDYTVASYKDNTTPGTATVTVTGKGNYTGEATGEFTIKMEVPMISKQPVGQTYKMSEWQEKQAEALTVEASVSSGDLSYQWYSNTKDSTENAAKIENAAESSYTPGITEAGTTWYYCVVTNTLDGYTAEATSQTAKITVEDDIAPEGTISVNKNSWKSFIKTFTFGLFFRENYDVAITASDAQTSIKSIEYYISATAISEEELKELDKKQEIQWLTYANGFSIEKEGKYIIYAKIQDKAGNTVYISSDGMILDKTSPTEPTVSGYTSGTWTKQDVTITVSDSKALSGIARYEYSTDGGKSWNTITATDSTETNSNGPANIEEAQLAISGDTDTVYLIRAVANADKEYTGSSIYSESVSVTVKIDETNPVISGIENNGTYCPGQIFTVTEAHLKEVKINGTVVRETDGKYTLNTEGKCTVTATDEAGNSATYTVTVGHTWNTEVSYEWSEDGKSCTAKRTCTKDSAHAETATATVTSSVTTQPTCTEMGKRTYAAAFTEEWAGNPTKEVADIAAAGHKYAYHKAVSAECEKSGMAEHYTCENCSLIFDKDKQVTTAEELTISSTGHTFSAHIKEQSLIQKQPSR